MSDHVSGHVRHGLSDHEPSRPTRMTRLVISLPEVALAVEGAHIALLDPFLPASQIHEGVLSELRGIFADVVPFAFVLGEAARFPSGEAYLPPAPVLVFRRITNLVRHTFPEVIGHPTSLAGSIPHLPLSDEAAESVATPLEVHAREALLLLGEGAHVTVLAIFGFGTSAA